MDQSLQFQCNQKCEFKSDSSIMGETYEKHSLWKRGPVFPW